jgi:prolipoprotein diacylglyceryl transferase
MPAPALAAIPSPPSSSIGPFHAYGLMIALGVLAATELASRRWKARGGDPGDIWAIALWAVPAGLIGARLYHVVTDWKAYFPDRPLEALFIWQGGLGIPGGIIAGVLVGVYVARKRGLRVPVALDVVAPALPLAQAIGRLGNWFNQEVFGRPTDLPWGLEIAPRFRPDAYPDAATFHPTFLYEALWNLALVGLLILIDRRRSLRPGNVFLLYVGGYALGRLWVESLRSDFASQILGVRVNIWTSLLTLVAVLVVLVGRGVTRRPDDSDEPYRDGHVAPGGPIAADEAADPPVDVPADAPAETAGEEAP